jgi:hypothetical protein
VIDDLVARCKLAAVFANAINDLVRDRRKGLIEEPDLTSRAGQRLEDKFNGRRIAGHKISVITETLPSHGKGSLEKPLGSDLYIAFSVQPLRGPEITKGVYIQAKRIERLSHEMKSLLEQCRRMEKVTKKGSIVWVYGYDGIVTAKAGDMRTSSPTMTALQSMFFEIFACTIGDRRQVPKGDFGDRDALATMLKERGAKNAVWLELEEKRRLRSA